MRATQAYMNTYKLPCVITRGNNVYGPHQYPEKLVPKFALLAMLGRKMPIHGDGKALRSYLCVSCGCCTVCCLYASADFTAPAAMLRTRRRLSMSCCTRAWWARCTTWAPARSCPRCR